MAPETIAGRYRVDREIGRGGMGSVWLATDDRLGRTVAIKGVGHLPGESVPDLARALREARSSAALNHRNVVSVYDVVEEGDQIWLVMEHVPGRTLAEIVAQEGPIPPARAARIGAQVADGLSAAHTLGTVHRDVKPGNILVTDDDVAKISDFGIARTFGQEKLTQSGAMTGTPAYFAPELARGGDPNPASDVWALGATLYAAVEGRTPYPQQDNALAMLAMIAREAPPQPERAGGLAQAIGRMMDPDAGSRWDMADCAHALSRLQDEDRDERTREQTAVAAAPVVAAPVATAPVTPSEPVAAAPPSATTRRSRSRGLLLAGAAAAVLVIVIAVAATVLGEDPEPSASDPTPRDAPSRTASSEPSPEPTEQTEEAEEASDESSEEAPAPAPQPAGGKRGFVADYYAVLPGDTETGYSMLSESYQDDLSYDDYDGFWSTIDSVTVEDTRNDGSDAVLVTLTYVTDGSSEQETRRIFVERADQGFSITGDEVAGS